MPFTDIIEKVKGMGRNLADVAVISGNPLPVAYRNERHVAGKRCTERSKVGFTAEIAGICLGTGPIAVNAKGGSTALREEGR